MTNYPAAVDDLTKLPRYLDAQHEDKTINDLIDAVRAIQTQLGTTASGILTLPNGLKFVTLTTAITANSTTTTAAAGSIGITSHATGVGKLFISDGEKWQYAVVA